MSRRPSFLISALAAVATLGLAIATPAKAQSISATLAGYDLVKVGNPGNAAQVSDIATQNGFGAVAYDFWIGKNHVTIGQYAEFLNAVAKSDPRGLWNASMDSDQRIRGITRSGTSGAFIYTVVGPNGTNPVGAQSAANRPITYVSWFDAARFANWMANGKVLDPINEAAALALIDDGAYTLGTATSGNAVAKNFINLKTGAAPTFYIPTENEWYKAAYYSPVKVSGTAPGYYVYGTQSDTAPGNGWDGTTALADKDLANQANYRISSRYAVTGTTTDPGASGNQNVLTDVGAFTNSFSYYGAFDMSGNVWDWHDLDGSVGSFRGLRGGNWNISREFNVSSANRLMTGPSSEDDIFGFRLASPVPEPSTWVMAAGGLACAAWGACRRRTRGRKR
jgi:formylglycine-generating enzyme required for sulfatase activity